MQRTQQGNGWHLAQTDTESTAYTLYDQTADTPLFNIPSFVIEQEIPFFNPFKWSMDNFEIGRHLGSGAFGQIYLAREKRSQAWVALKIQSKEKIEEGGILDCIAKEIEIQSHLNHPHIVSMFGFFTDEENVVVILEYVPGGELFKKMRKMPTGKFSQKQAAKYIFQFIQALLYLHSKKVIHRDIKPENILLDAEDNIKLADFGLATPFKKDGKRTSKVGTDDYMCPEIVTKKPYDFGADIWATGVLAFELCSGRAPFACKKQDQEGTYKKISCVDFECPYYFSDNLVDFVCSILQKDPNERMTLEDALEHDWIVMNYDEDMDEDQLL